MTASIALRWADEADLDRLRAVMTAAIDRLQHEFLSPEQVAASHVVMGLDSQLVRDRTYLVAEDGGTVVGCGGWSRRATLYGGDGGAAPRDATLLDPATRPARIRAMYTHPDHARRGIGRLILARCEGAAVKAGFGTAELMATLSGEPLYRACGYRPIERIEALAGEVRVPLIRMEKRLSG